MAGPRPGSSPGTAQPPPGDLLRCHDIKPAPLGNLAANRRQARPDDDPFVAQDEGDISRTGRTPEAAFDRLRALSQSQTDRLHRDNAALAVTTEAIDLAQPAGDPPPVPGRRWPARRRRRDWGACHVLNRPTKTLSTGARNQSIWSSAGASVGCSRPWRVASHCSGVGPRPHRLRRPRGCSAASPRCRRRSPRRWHFEAHAVSITAGLDKGVFVQSSWRT